MPVFKNIVIPLGPAFILLAYLVKGDANPLMFHQANLRAYDGTHFLLGDLLDATLAKYRALYTLPVVSPTMEVISDLGERRFWYRSAVLKATWTPGNPGTVTFFSDSQTLMPVTGMCRSGAERYGGDCIYWANVPANKNYTLPLR